MMQQAHKQDREDVGMEGVHAPPQRSRHRDEKIHDAERDTSITGSASCGIVRARWKALVWNDQRHITDLHRRVRRIHVWDLRRSIRHAELRGPLVPAGGEGKRR